MKTPFFIVYNEIDSEQEIELLDAITSNFISKKGKANAYVIIAEDMEAKEIYELLASKLSFNPELMVIELKNFYGYFLNSSVFDWLKESFPDWKWANDKNTSATRSAKSS